ncbi:type III pantothenate kinase [Pseudoxanthomonas putridarboris]|uniref:Type III pantothenate kinase n=1 Tax=Pseudoxanthomonas putridarboris TaxID=752605 RepID=A0ABU9IV31_9GAMM
MNHWLFDLGNSRLKCATLQVDGTLGRVEALGHDEAGFIAALDATVPPRAELGAAVACLASVASPALTAAVVEWLTTRFACISIARTQPAMAGVRIAYDEPARMGVDRFLALLAARARAPQAWLVAGVGTALTIDLLASDGRHMGGRIGPSPRLMREALHRAAVQLPAEGGGYVEFARGTEDALASGCEGAAAGLVERSLLHARAVLGHAPALLLHGGGADVLRPLLPESVMASSLVLEGLAQWARAGIPA